MWIKDKSAKRCTILFGNPFIPPILTSFQCWEWGMNATNEVCLPGELPPQSRWTGNPGTCGQRTRRGHFHRNSEKTALWVGLACWCVCGRGGVSETCVPSCSVQSRLTLGSQWQVSIHNFFLTAVVLLRIICGWKQSTGAVDISCLYIISSFLEFTDLLPTL